MKEIWKSVVGYEGCYEVSNKGRVKSLDRNVRGVLRLDGHLVSARKLGKTLKLYHRKKDGYVIASIQKNGKVKKAKVHRLVAEAFLPNPENKPHVNHKNSIRSDNNVANLEWCTIRENADHSVAMGMRAKGERANKSNLLPLDILKIREAYANKEGSYAVLGKRFGVTAGAIGHIVKKKAWKHV